MDRTTLARTITVAALASALIVAIAVLHRRPGEAPSEATTPSASQSLDLSAELRRCSALGPDNTKDDTTNDAEHTRCRAVWEENRRHFFNGPARSAAAPTSSGLAGGQP